MATAIDNKLHLLVTPYQNKKLPVYNWYNFNHSFSRDLVWYLIDRFGLNEDSIVLDPFCGSGTTLLATKEKRISCVGVDILPLSVFMSNAKLQNYNSRSIIRKLKTFDPCSENKDRILPKIPDIKILHKVFAPETLASIFATKRWIQRIRDKKLRYFFLAALLSVIEDAAFARKDGGFVRIIPDKEVPDFRSLLLNKLNKMLKEVNSFPYAQNRVESKAILGDARRLCFSKGSFDAVITSPPYLNRHDYTRVYILELAVGFCMSNEEIKNLRYKALRSHVEAKKTISAKSYIQPGIVTEIINDLHGKTLPNEQVIPMIQGYFEDVYLALKEMIRVIKRQGFAAFVIGDVRYGGILIPVVEIVTEMGQSLGLVHLETLTARVRGNSPQQMGMYGKVPAKESIIIWQKKKKKTKSSG